MLPLPDGTFRYSPHDLVAYLEGEFAAWCERMFAEGNRARSARSLELEWATPDPGDQEAALAAGRLGSFLARAQRNGAMRAPSFVTQNGTPRSPVHRRPRPCT